MNSNKKKSVFLKNNDLIRSKYDLTSSENRLYNFISNEVKKQTPKEDNTVVNVSFPRRMLTELSDKRSSEIARVKSTLSKFRKKSIYIQEITDSGEEIWSEYGFISGFSYNKNKDEFSVEMSPKIRELIMKDHKLGYTPVNINAVFHLKSVYSQRFYELIRLKSWTQKPITYSVDEIKEFLMLDKKKSYDRYWNLKNKVIDVAVDELNDAGLFDISYKEIKNGKAVIAIEFTVSDLEDRTYFKTATKKVVFEDENHENLLDAIEDMYIPNERVFTKGALREAKRNFVGHDFKDDNLSELFELAASITMEKDNIDVIGIRSFNYFKSTLENLIDDYYKKLTSY